jgi:hypothetical protein
MPQCQFPIFCYFCILEKLHMKYSQNWMKQKGKVPIFIDTRWSPKQRRRGASRQAYHRVVRPAPGLHRQEVWPPGPPPDTALPPIYSPQRENPKHLINFLENILQAAAVIDARSGGPISSSRHPVGEGNHHQRPSSSPCLPPE